MYAFFSNFYPKKLRELLFNQFEYFSIKVRKEFIVGSLFFFSVGISISIAFQFAKTIFKNFPDILALIFLFIISFVIIQGFIYTVINIIATNRGKFIENVLPDALQLISANLRAGMTIDRAMIAANRPEFGYFNYHFNIVGREISTGTEVSDALMNMTKRVKSEKFKKTMELIVTGMRSGGELSKLLSEVAENLVHQKTVEDKVKASVMTYLIFIGAAVGFAAPLLYGLSTVIVSVLVNTFSSVDIPASSAQNMPFAIDMSEELAILLPEFVKMYTRVSLLTLAVMASFLLGLINKGEAKHGISYIPLIGGFGLLLYWAVSTGASALFSSIM